MKSLTLPVSVLLASLLLGCTKNSDSPDGSAAPPELEGIFASMDQGKWELARDGLEALLRGDGDREALRGQRAEIETALQQCMFWLANGEPDPMTTVAGEIVSLDRSTGDLHIRYGPEHVRFFEPDVAGWLRPPVHFTGPHTVHLEGASYPVPKVFALDVCMKEGEPHWYRCYWGNPERPGSFLHAAKIVVQDDRPEVEATTPEFVDPSPGVKEQPFTVDVQVDAGTVTMFYDNRRVVGVDRTVSHFGQVRLAGLEFTQFVLLEMRGPVATTWLQDRLVAQAGAPWREFLAGWKAEDHLPSWMLD